MQTGVAGISFGSAPTSLDRHQDPTQVHTGARHRSAEPTLRIAVFVVYFTPGIYLMVYVSSPRPAPHRVHRRQAQVQVQKQAQTTAAEARRCSTKPGERCLWLSRCRFGHRCRGLHSRQEIVLFSQHAMEADATDWQLCSAGVCCHARGSDVALTPSTVAMQCLTLHQQARSWIISL